MKPIANTRYRSSLYTSWVMTRRVGLCLHERLFVYRCDEPRSEVAYRLRWARIKLRNAVRQ